MKKSKHFIGTTRKCVYRKIKKQYIFIIVSLLHSKSVIGTIKIHIFEYSFGIHNKIIINNVRVQQNRRTSIGTF